MCEKRRASHNSRISGHIGADLAGTPLECEKNTQKTHFLELAGTSAQI
jgi:hypothetical protein